MSADPCSCDDSAMWKRRALEAESALECAKAALLKVDSRLAELIETLPVEAEAVAEPRAAVVAP